MELNTISETLALLGLGNYEVKAYLTLLELYSKSTTSFLNQKLPDKESPFFNEQEKITAKAISNAANIPRTRIYDVLNTLETKGWASTLGGKPRTYLPILPDIVLDSKYREIRKHIERLKDDLGKIYTGKVNKFVLINNADQILSRIVNLISNSDKHLFIHIPFVLDNEIKFINKYLDHRYHIKKDTIISVDPEILSDDKLLSSLSKYTDELKLLSDLPKLYVSGKEMLAIQQGCGPPLAFDYQSYGMANALFSGLMANAKNI